MAKFGRTLTSGIMRRYHYIATAGQTTISGSDDNGHSLQYYDGNYLFFWRNGTLLTWKDEYETPDGETINLTGSLSLDANDEIVIAVFDAFAIADHYTKGEVDADFLKQPGTSIDPGLGFATWRTPNTKRSTIVQGSLEVRTDGSSSAQIYIQIDEDGGTTVDYSLNTLVGSAVGSPSSAWHTFMFVVPAGASYRYWNASDPDAGNEILSQREITL